MHTLYADRHAVRHLVVKEIQELFSDYLGRYNTLGLVGQSVVGEEMRRGLRLLKELVLELAEAVALER